jgi:hypothetical protein
VTDSVYSSKVILLQQLEGIMSGAAVTFIRDTLERAWQQQNHRLNEGRATHQK